MHEHTGFWYIYMSVFMSIYMYLISESHKHARMYLSIQYILMSTLVYTKIQYYHANTHERIGFWYGVRATMRYQNTICS